MKKKNNSKKSAWDIIDKIINNIELFLKKIFTNKWLYYLFFIIVALGIYYWKLKDEIISLDVSKDKIINYYLIIGGCISLVIVVLLIINQKFKKMAIHIKYIIFAMILGTIYLFASPVFTQSDESFHFLRAYQVADGNLISPYDEAGNAVDALPLSLYETLWDDNDRFPEYKTYEDSYRESKIELNKDQVVTENIRAANYVFLNYFPHAIGMKLGIMLNMSPYTIGLLGRITNMIICLSIIALSIKIIPVCKKTLAVIMLTPTVLSYCASLSADGIIIAMAFLLTALVLKYIYEKPKLNWKNYLLLLLIISFVSTCKVAYLPIIGILIFLPYDCFNSKKHKWLYTISLILIGIILCLTWINISSIVIETNNSTYAGIYKYINFLLVFINTYVNDTVSYIQNMFAGYYLYQCQVNPVAIISITYLIISIISYLSENTEHEIKYIDKFLTSMIIILVILLVSYALFTGNTEATSKLINGIQGRYFIPIIPLIAFFVGKSKINCSEIKLFDISIILNLYILLNMLIVFII